MATIEQLSEPSDAETKAIIALLDEVTRQRGFVWSPERLTLALIEGGQIQGGLIGQTDWGWLYIQILAVARELRGLGHGRRLIEQAERLALARGCHSAWLDTFSFQAPAFYHHLGYRPFGTLPDYPSGNTRLFLHKRLEA